MSINYQPHLIYALAVVQAFLSGHPRPPRRFLFAMLRVLRPSTGFYAAPRPTPGRPRYLGPAHFDHRFIHVSSHMKLSNTTGAFPTGFPAPPSDTP